MPTIRSKKFILRPHRRGDEKSLTLNISNKKIYRNTLRIPHPYTLELAQKWISKNLKEAKKKNPSHINFVIEVDGEATGGIGLNSIQGHKAEIGYWLGEKYWGRGIMSQAVKLVTKFGFRRLKLKRIFAHVFPWNRASMRVLEKAGFKFEGVLRKNHKKGSRFIDSHLFAKVK